MIDSTFITIAITYTHTHANVGVIGLCDVKTCLFWYRLGDESGQSRPCVLCGPCKQSDRMEATCSRHPSCSTQAYAQL